MLHPLLVHQTHRRIRERQEAVVLFAQGITVAGKGAHEQLQLVVSVLADVNAHAPEGVLQMVRTLLQVGVGIDRHHHVEVGVHELLALAGDYLLHPRDVFYGHLVVGVRDARVPVLLFVQQRQLPLLVGQKDYLVVHHRIGVRYVVDDRHEVHRHLRVVHFDIGIGPDQRGQRGVVHVHEAVYFTPFPAHRDGIFVCPEVGHRHDAVLEVHGEVAVYVLARLGLVQEPRLHAAVAQLVVHLADLHEEVAPLLAVVGEQAALLRLLRDGQVAHAVRVGTPLEVAEIGFGEELAVSSRFSGETFAHEDVLLVQGVPFAQRLCQSSEQLRELVIAVYVRAVFLYGIFDFQHGRIFAGLGVQYADSVRIFH